MKLRRKAALLRLLRVCSVLVPATLTTLCLCRLFKADCTLPLVIYSVAVAAVLLLVHLRYRCFELTLGTEALHYSLGLILRREVFIEYKSICALRIITSPYSRLVSLCNVVLYIGGSRMITPLIPFSCAEEISRRLEGVRRCSGAPI